VQKVTGSGVSSGDRVVFFPTRLPVGGSGREAWGGVIPGRGRDAWGENEMHEEEMHEAKVEGRGGREDVDVDVDEERERECNQTCIKNRRARQ